MPDLMTIKRVGRKTNVSECAIKQNVVQLLEVLEIEQKVEVLEHMAYCKELRHRKIEEYEEEIE